MSCTGEMGFLIFWPSAVFKLYSWHICDFDKARKFAVSGEIDALYLHIFSAIFNSIFFNCPFEDFKRGGHFLTKNGESNNFIAKI